MNFIDLIIIIFLALGALAGFKRGLISSTVSLVGTFLILILSYYLKNPLSALMYTYLPFFEFSGFLSGVTVLNIVLYEAIAFVVTFVILKIILNIIIKITGVLDKFVSMTIILTLPAKLLGALVGLLESFLFLYLVLFIGAQLNIINTWTKESKIATDVLEKTPFLSNIMGDAWQSVDEIYSLKNKYENSKNGDAYNIEALDILMKYEVITPKSARKLIEKEKIKSPGAIDVVKKYEEKK